MLQDGTSPLESIPKDVDDAIAALSDADWIRLQKAANQLSWRGRYSADELLNEAFIRILDGTRKYRAEVGFVRFMFGVMKSLVSSDCKSQSRYPEVSLDRNKPDSEETNVVDVPALDQTPEEIVAAAQDAAHFRKSILALYEDDPTAQTAAEGRMLEMSPQEIQELTGLDEKGYATVLRKLRRRYEKAYPKGWNNG